MAVFGATTLTTMTFSVAITRETKTLDAEWQTLATVTDTCLWLFQQLIFYAVASPKQPIQTGTAYIHHCHKQWHFELTTVK